MKRKELVHFYLIPCWAGCSPDHCRRFGRNRFTTMETHCVEHAGRARVMFGRGGVCFCVLSLSTKAAQLQAHICLGRILNVILGPCTKQGKRRQAQKQHLYSTCFKGCYVKLSV